MELKKNLRKMILCMLLYPEKKIRKIKKIVLEIRYNIFIFASGRIKSLGGLNPVLVYVYLGI